MISVGIRDLRNKRSRYIDRLHIEHRILITNRGRPVGELRRVVEDRRDDPRPGRYADLVAAGIIRPPTDDGDPFSDWPAPNEIRLAPGTVATLIDEDRHER